MIMMPREKSLGSKIVIWVAKDANHVAIVRVAAAVVGWFVGNSSHVIPSQIG